MTAQVEDALLTKEVKFDQRRRHLVSFHSFVSCLTTKGKISD